MGLLVNKKCYLGGPIESDNNPVNWRPAVKKELADRFGLNVFDPFADPKQGKAVALKDAKNKKDYDAMREIAYQFVRKDLGEIDRSDFTVSYLPVGVPTVGTVHEIVEADARKKPALLVCPDGKEKIPSWYYGVVRHQYMFGSWDALYGYLQEVHAGKHTADHRWWFVSELI